MIDSLLQSKLAGFLNQFFQCKDFKIFSLSEMGFTNFKIKSKFVEDLSQKLQIPLELVSGQIGSLKLNKPWQKLFFLNSPVKIQIDGLKLKTRIKNSFNEGYLLKNKQLQIDRLTESLFNPLDSFKGNNSNVNKRIKQFFLNKIHFQLKNFVMQIQVDLKQRISIITKYDSLIYKKNEEKSKENESIDCEITNFGVYYKVGADRQIQLIHPTNIQLSRAKIKELNYKKSFKTIRIQELQFNINNMNYGDTARIFLLVNWHNSFKNIPYQLWTFKPFVLTQCKPYQKFLYIAKLIHYEIVQSNMRKQLKLRREYLNMYKKMLSQEHSGEMKIQLQKLQRLMPIWKIMAYRSYCINLMKHELQRRKCQEKKKNTQPDMVAEKQKESNLNYLVNGSWFKNLFATQKNKEELQQQFFKKVNTFEDIPNDIESIFTVHISRVKFKLSIVSNFGVEPFISIVSVDCSFKFAQNLLDKRWESQFCIVKYKVEYEKYLGHCDRYRNFISECKQHLNLQQDVGKINEAERENEESDDEFDEIQSFFQVEFRNDTKKIEVNVLPFDLFLNHEVIEKFSILLNIEKLSKITRMDKYEQIYITKYDPIKFVDQEKEKIISLRNIKQLKENQLSPFKLIKSKTEMMSPKKPDRYNEVKSLKMEEEQPESMLQDKIQRQIQIRTAFNIIIPMNLRTYPNPELVFQFGQVKLLLRPKFKAIEVNNLVIKFKILENQEEANQSIQQIVNYLSPKISQKFLLRKFNFKAQIQEHQNFDKSLIQVQPIFIEFPPQEYAMPLIQLIYLHIPKSKEVRFKQNRRKQTIGEQFMDAYQNLNDHIAKSIIISSEKQTMRNIIRQKKTKQATILCKGLTITHKYFQVLFNQTKIHYNYLSLDKIILSSDNQKKIKLSILNIQRTIKTLKEINLQIKKESIKKGSSNPDPQVNNKDLPFNIELTQLNLYLNINIKNEQKLMLSLQNISFFQNREINTKEMDCKLMIIYDEEIVHVPSRFNKIPIVEECLISYKESNKFNLVQKNIHFQPLHINIKPSLFTLLSNLFKNYTLEESACCIITNENVNTIKIKQSHRNYYHQCKYHQQFTIQNYYCQMNLFGNKYQLSFNQHKDEVPKHHIQCINIGQNHFLINKEVSTNHYVLQSNMRLINHQDRTIWLKITQHSSSLSPNESQQPVRYHFNRQSNEPFDIDLTQRVIFDEQLSQKRGLTNDKCLRRKNLFQSEQISKKNNATGKNVSIALKSNQNINILIDQNQFNYLQFFDQGKSFTEIKITHMFTPEEIVISTQEEDEDIEYLIIRPIISKQQGIQGLIYTFHIYSPVYIVNRTPWDMQYKISKSEFHEDELTNSKINRKKSLQLVSLKKIDKLSFEKIRTVHYDNIQMIKLIIDTHSRQIFSLKSIINKLKEKRSSDQKDFISVNELITLRNNRTEIQMILNIQFSDNILKLKIYPEYVFINMTKDVLSFMIKENQITYPQIVLNNIKKNKIENDHYHQKKGKKEVISNMNLYISLNEEKIKQRAALKQILQIFQNQLEIHTGEIDIQDYKKKIIFNSQFLLKKDSLKKTHGYFSDNNSQPEYKEDIAKADQLLDQEKLFFYSQKKYNVYKRVINIQKYFKLVLFIPTIHIINKSKAIFYVKSSCENLIKISKEDHNFIHINDNQLNIQAIFEQEEISLNEWMKMKVNRLGTIYYSKDMISHHASGYQSKEYTFRKKRMKKTPKIFYKILLCKYERGQKILIQESQYPPYSFINNTQHRIKIQEMQEHFYEQLISKGDMGEYSPKDPYHIPFFRLLVAENYQYKILKEFSGIQKQVYLLQNDIILSVEQYKDKIIVIVKEKEKEDNMQKSLQGDMIDRNELLLQQMSKLVISLKLLHLVVMNKWNRQLNSNVIQNACFIYQNKNHKDYYKLSIASVQGYDYMQRQPKYIYKVHQKPKINLLRMEIQYPQQKKTESPFLNVDLVVNYHKNAVIVERCDIMLAQISFFISADLILAYVKNYYSILTIFHSTYSYYIGSKQEKKSGNILYQNFIVESLNWHGTSLKIQSRNLSIMQTFLNKQYEKWVVKFINWLGDIKPIEFSSYHVENQEITLLKLKNEINLKNKMIELGGLLMDYPKSLLKEFLMLFIRSQEKSVFSTLKTYKKIFKSFQYIIVFILNLNDTPASRKISYKEFFIQTQKENNNIIEKMLKFKYCQWKYSQNYNLLKLNKKIKRLQRYNTRDQILKYDYEKAFIKIAMDTFLNNKLFRKIEHIYKLNSKYIIALVHSYLVLCMIEQRSWLIIKVEHVLSLIFTADELSFTFWEENKSIEQKGSKISSMKIGNIFLQPNERTELKQLLKENILSHYY